MASNPDNLKKLVKFIDKISNESGNEWFREELINNFNISSTANVGLPAIDQIYEYCIKLILKEHAERFYSDFKLVSIKSLLIQDFIRMEEFRRSDKFDDFCLAAFQQFEAIVNNLFFESSFIEYFVTNKEVPAIIKYDKITNVFVRTGSQTIGKLIFQTNDLNKINEFLSLNPSKWFFNNRYRAVLYFYYYNKELKYSTDGFEKIYELGNFLYQGRNLNHRGTPQNKYQQSILDNILPKKHKYYFRFLGFLEDFISSINNNIRI